MSPVDKQPSAAADRRTFLKSTGITAGLASGFSGALLGGQAKGANDRIAVAVIGTGQMGRSNLSVAMQIPEVEVVAVSDVFQPNAEYAQRLTKGRAKVVKDFREIIADKSIDAVCIGTPDHWHPYMAIEACKAGKDVYVEKPISVTVDEGRMMVEAARKYNRVVQAGTMQRSAEHFQKAVEVVQSGQLGKITMVHTWNYAHAPKEGIGSPADSKPPAGLDWDMWLGPAPMCEYNANRFGYDMENIERPRWFSHFRWFWEYAGGMMTDWGVHWLDIVQWALKEEQPKAITAIGGKYYLTDNRETPDTLKVTYEYPSGVIATYENRNNNSQSMFKKSGGILFYGENGTMFVDRTEFYVTPEVKRVGAEGRGRNEMMAQEGMMPELSMRAMTQGNLNHWKNFVSCIRSRAKPISDIEVCYKSTATCLLGNVALRSGKRVDFDTEKQTASDPDVKKLLSREHRKPWELKV